MAQQQYPHLGGLENLMTFNMAAEEFSFYACDHDSDSSKIDLLIAIISKADNPGVTRAHATFLVGEILVRQTVNVSELDLRAVQHYPGSALESKLLQLWTLSIQLPLQTSSCGIPNINAKPTMKRLIRFKPRLYQVSNWWRKQATLSPELKYYVRRLVNHYDNAEESLADKKVDY
ncbi:uncharacterized protein LOC134191095 [Corticium candelabrum]|uniref:uncharacterized protein LOC134191095 n=1 Tax=Corticium candelabrum TaxID=121492 RepID=UPI002E26F0DB|nr:uncharacterized protein LOC134191095 [Corticium candelabrum]